MNYFRRRRLKKDLKHLLHEARHARNMREDIAPTAEIEAVRAAEAALKQAWEAKDSAAIEAAAKELTRCVEVIYPAQRHPRVREYLEIAVVAISVAMAFRTFFIQPFKIPTGSMEPTLYGIKASAQMGKTVMDYFPLNVVQFLLFGDRYIEVRAPKTGVAERLMQNQDGLIYSLNGVVPPFREEMMRHFSIGDYVTKGQLLASGRQTSGDHIFVNKVRYNFVRPKRGDIFVFSTDGVHYPNVKEDTFYIKRLVGLPGEEVSIDPPYLIVNGERVQEPYVFERQAKAREQGYIGYVIPQVRSDMKRPAIYQRNTGYTLGPDQYLPMGDNTMHSLDGRYFGGVPEENIVGPAFAIYWPLSARWGFTQ